MGYDLERFSNAPDPLLICPVCRKVLEDPVQLDCVRKNSDLPSSRDNNSQVDSLSCRRLSLSPTNGASPNGDAIEACNTVASAKGSSVGARKSSRRTASHLSVNTEDPPPPPPPPPPPASRSRKDSQREDTSKSTNSSSLHVFCRSCIIDHFAESGGFSCPIDGEKFKRNTKRSLINPPPAVIQSSLSSLEIACEFTGCSVVATISSLADHLEECTFKPPPVIKINLSCLTPSSSGSTLGDYHAVPSYHSTYSSAQSRQYVSNNNQLSQQQQPEQVHNYTSQYVASHHQQQQSPYSLQSSSLYSNQGTSNTATTSTSFPDYYSNYYSSSNNYYANSGNTPSTVYDEDECRQQQNSQQTQQCSDQQQFIPSGGQQSLGYKRKKKHAHIYLEMDDKLTSIERRYQEKIEVVRSQLHSRLETLSLNQVQRIESKYQKDIENLERNHRCQLMLFEEKIKNELDTMKNFIRSTVTSASFTSATPPASTSTPPCKKQGRKSKSNTVQFPDETSLSGSFFASFGPITESTLSLTDELQANLTHKVETLCQAKNEQLVALIKAETARTQELLEARQHLFENKLLSLEAGEKEGKGKRNTRSGETAPETVTVKSLKIQLNKCHEMLKRTQEQVIQLDQQLSSLDKGDASVSTNVSTNVTTNVLAVDRPKGTPGRKRKHPLPAPQTSEKLKGEKEENIDEEDDADTVILTDTSVEGKVTKSHKRGRRGALVDKTALASFARRKGSSLNKLEAKSTVVTNIRKKALGKATITMANVVTGKTRSAIRRTVQQVTSKKTSPLAKKRALKKNAVESTVDIETEKSEEEKTKESEGDKTETTETTAPPTDEPVKVQKRGKPLKRKGRPPAVKDASGEKIDQVTKETHQEEATPPTKKSKILKEVSVKKSAGRKSKNVNTGKNQLNKLRRSARQQPTTPARSKRLPLKSKGEAETTVATEGEEKKDGAVEEAAGGAVGGAEKTDSQVASQDEKAQEEETGAKSVETGGRHPRRGCGFRGRGRIRLKSGSGASFPSSRRGGVGISKDVDIDSSTVAPTPTLPSTETLSDTLGRDPGQEEDAKTAAGASDTTESSTDATKECPDRGESVQEQAAADKVPESVSNVATESEASATTVGENKCQENNEVSVNSGSEDKSNVVDTNVQSYVETSDQSNETLKNTASTVSVPSTAEKSSKEKSQTCESKKETNISLQSNAKVGDDILRAAMDAIDDADQDEIPSINSRNVLSNTNSLPLPPVASIAGKQFFASFPLSIPFSLPVVFGRVSSASVTGTNVIASTVAPLSYSSVKSTTTNVTYASSGSNLASVPLQSTGVECATNQDKNVPAKGLSSSSALVKDASSEFSVTSDLNSVTTDGSSQESTLPFRKRRKTAQSSSGVTSTCSGRTSATPSNLLSTAGSSDLSGTPIDAATSGTSSPQGLLSSPNDLMTDNELESNSHENSPANDIINQILENLDNKSIEGTENGSPKGVDDLGGTEDDLSNLISESDADEILKQLHSSDPGPVDAEGVESTDTLNASHNPSACPLQSTPLDTSLNHDDVSLL